MASVINALIVTGHRLAGSEVPPGTREIALAVEGFRFLPITNVARGVLCLSDGDARLVDGFYELTQGVAVWAKGLSHGRRVLYIHSEFFGGEELQAAMGWQDARLFSARRSPVRTAPRTPPYERVPAAHMAINAGLRALGLVPAPGQDEYSTAGLEQHQWSDKSIAE